MKRPRRRPARSRAVVGPPHPSDRPDVCHPWPILPRCNESASGVIELMPGTSSTRLSGRRRPRALASGCPAATRCCVPGDCPCSPVRGEIAMRPRRCCSAYRRRRLGGSDSGGLHPSDRNVWIGRGL